MIYRIRDWDRLYETHQTRRLKRLHWVPVPNQMDGDGYVELVDHPDGMAHLGCWLAILEIASRCEPRGTLARDMRGTCAHDARSIARIARAPVQMMEAAWERLIKIGWIEPISAVESNIARIQHGAPRESVQITRAFDAAPARDLRAEWKGMEGNGMEGKADGSKAPVESTPELPTDSNENGVPQKTAPPLHDWETPEAETQWVRDALMDYTAKIPGWNLPPPDDALCQRVMALVGRKHLPIIGQVLKELYRAGKRPSESWGWFPTVIEEYLKPKAVAR